MKKPYSKAEDCLECEKWTTFLLLMFVGGFLGAFTYTIRGGVFCNAQTANFILSAIALGHGDFHEFFYYFIPMTAYFLGAFISESVPEYIKIYLHVRWDTIFLGPVHINQICGFPSKFSPNARQKFAGVLSYVKNF